MSAEGLQIFPCLPQLPKQKEGLFLYEEKSVCNLDTLGSRELVCGTSDPNTPVELNRVKIVLFDC